MITVSYLYQLSVYILLLPVNDAALLSITFLLICFNMFFFPPQVLFKAELSKFQHGLQPGQISHRVFSWVEHLSVLKATIHNCFLQQHNLDSIKNTTCTSTYHEKNNVLKKIIFIPTVQ